MIRPPRRARAYATALVDEYEDCSSRRAIVTKTCVFFEPIPRRLPKAVFPFLFPFPTLEHPRFRRKPTFPRERLPK